jgi:hypothetical protein
MGEVITIYNTDIELPEQPPIEDIECWGTDDISEQYWRRHPLPEFFEQVEYDKNGDALLDSRQREYAIEQVNRCKDGFWFMNNGIPTYITGKNYFYLQFWKLEDDIYPDYRDLDRRYFIYLNHWENVPWCLGVLIGKKRRQGQTSIGTSNLVYECVFYKNSNCGLTSKTEKDAKVAFTNMVAFGYRQLPVFLKPKQLNNKDSVTELVFAHKSVNIKGTKGGAIDNDTGHRSKVDYRAPGKNAYDSGRLTRGLFDEGGKFPLDVPFSEFLSIVSKTLVKGVKKVGFIECPSTMNDMTKGGGAEYKKVWELADFKKFPRTPNRMVRYFSPAYDSYMGFIDRYGMSVIEAPTPQQYDYLVENFVGVGDLTEEDVKLGAREYLLSKRINLEGNLLEEEIRMNPFDEREMFMSSLQGSVYNTFKLNEQIDWLNFNKDCVERGNLVWENGDEFYKEVIHSNGVREMKVNKLLWINNPNGVYEKVTGWMPKEMNNVYQRAGYFSPNGNYAIRIGCDPFKYDKTKDDRKSNCAAYAYQMEDLADENNKYNDAFVMRFCGRPATTDMQYEYVLKMAWFCGCQVLFERNVTGWKKFFEDKLCSNFLTWLPNEVEPGIYTGGGNNKTTQQICDYTEAYIEKNVGKVYFPDLLGEKSGWLGFEVDNTQKYDDAMAAGFTLIAAKTKRYYKPQETTKSVESIMPYRQAL